LREIQRLVAKRWGIAGEDIFTGKVLDHTLPKSNDRFVAPGARKSLITDAREGQLTVANAAIILSTAPANSFTHGGAIKVCNGRFTAYPREAGMARPAIAIATVADF
jgi:hypothetical protein